MNQDLGKDVRRPLVAAYKEERFTLTFSQIKQRAGASRRKRVWKLAAGMAMFTAAMVLAGSMLLKPGPAPQPVDPMPTESGVTALRRDCESYWDTNKPAGVGLPELRTKELGPLQVLVYADASVNFVCGEQVREIDANSRILMWAPTTGLRHVAGQFVLGRVPSGAVKIDIVTPAGTLPAEIHGNLFVARASINGADGQWADHTIRADFPDRVLRVRLAKPIDLGSNSTARTAVCQELWSGLGFPAELAGQLSQRFGFELSDGRMLSLNGGPELMAMCLTVPGSGQQPHTAMVAGSMAVAGRVSEPFEQLYDATGGEFGYVFGRAPLGAQSGVVTLASGLEVELEFSGDFYAAQWNRSTPTQIPVKVQIDTATHRHVFENGDRSMVAK
jgi:hypothetical protein